MTMSFSLGSGDVIADRRYGYAEALAAAGDHAAAADLFAQVTEIAPWWGAAWLALGLASEKAGDIPAARTALHHAAALDRTDALGAAVHVARLEGRRPEQLPATFVATLFDQYADRFDAHLQDTLGYRGPDLLVAALHRDSPRATAGRVLDLGCGTGLVARRLAGLPAALDGVDLSRRMVEKARATDLYRSLHVAEILDHLRDVEAQSYDLVIAADVFVYFGDLGPVIQGSARVLPRGGTLAFTVQRSPDVPIGFGADMRFSHHPASLGDTVSAAGLRIASMEEVATRRDGGVDVPGLVVVALKA